MVFKKLSILISGVILASVLVGNSTAGAASVVSSATQYMNGAQIVHGKLVPNKPVTITAVSGAMTAEWGWVTYNNSVNDGNKQDIEFSLMKDIANSESERRYCIEAQDLAPYGVKAKLELWTLDSGINDKPYDLITSPNAFVPTTPLTNLPRKVCSAWTKIHIPAGPDHRRVSVMFALVVKQGAIKLRTASIESR